jgi:hypothetical protein
MIRTILVAALALVCVASTAQARPRNKLITVDPNCNVLGPCEGVAASRPASRDVDRHARIRAAQSGAQIVAHPSGCPSRLFCACGAAVRVFGSPIRSLWAAAIWFKFPRAAPAPGMVAVRSHHVFVLEADLGNGLWQVYDANSGGGATRIHARSLAGYAVVNPHGGA